MLAERAPDTAGATAGAARKPRIVIGVIGDDIHVVGNRIMQLALEESGCQVFNLRTRNRPEHFVQAALEVNATAVFVSSLNGEGEYWCADFRQRMQAVGLGGVLLYVGGNVVVGSRPEPEVVALFKGYGFDRVYHQRPDIGAAIVDLFQDIEHGASGTDARLQHVEAQRRQVLAHPLAGGLDTTEVARFLNTLPERRFPSVVYADRAQRGGVPLIQPRGGVPLFDEQLRLTKALDAAGADFIPLTIDSCTRHNQYDTAGQLLRRSEEEGRSLLNGYPLVCHGHELTRQLYTGLNKPVSLRHGTPDARLLAELAIGSGIVEIEGGGLCYCLPYSEGFPVDRALLYWQYVDRISALYSTPGRPIHRESFGPLSATLVPPAIAISIEIIEALLAAEQGVLSFAVSFGQTGSFIQDVASARVLRSLAREFLAEYGFAEVQLRLVYHQWMGQFPMQRERAAALIAGSALVAGVIDADKIVVKTVDEALGVPRAEVNAEAVDTVRYILRTFSAPETVASPAIDAEARLLASEVRSILNAIFALPGQAFWESVYRAFQLGWLDLPFSPHADNANLLVSMRDANRSIRIADAGRVPISAADAAEERRLLETRADRGEKTYRQMLADITLMV